MSTGVREGQEKALDVSVIIPAFNAADLVSDAVRSTLAQTLAPFEVLVVDDGSTDQTAARARAFLKVRLLGQPENRGQAAALNRGILESRGNLLAFLDADDVWRPRKLERQVAALAGNDELEAVYGLVEERVVGTGHPSGRDGRVLRARLPSALLIRRSALLRVGLFDETLRVGSVIEWASRAVAAGLRYRVLDEIVYERRIHGSNLGLVDGRGRSDYLGIVRAGLARRRGRREPSAS